jgi:hypothetical protein
LTGACHPDDIAGPLRTLDSVIALLAELAGRAAAPAIDDVPEPRHRSARSLRRLRDSTTP